MAATLLVTLVLTVAITIGWAIRRALPSRPRLGAAILMGSGVVGFIAAIWAYSSYREHELQRRLDRAVSSLYDCNQPRPVGAKQGAMHDFQCANDLRSAGLRSRDPSARRFDVSVHGDDALVFTLDQSLPSGRRHWVWFLDGAGRVIDKGELEITRSSSVSPTLLLGLSGISRTATVMVTIEPEGAPTEPTGQVISRGPLRGPARTH